MKVEDLMIGDWIRLKDDSLSYEESCMKITFLSNSTMCSLKHIRTNTPIGLIQSNENWLCPVFADDIEPIPLTSEILEKNGFGGKKPKVELILEDKRELLYNIYEKVLTIYWNSQIVFRSPCAYVHELQHALKLCGIEKEIVV